MSYQTMSSAKWQCLTEYPFGSISLRDCTAKGECFIIMWRPSTCALPSKNRSQNERLAPRERSLDETRSVYVSSVPLSQMWVEDVLPESMDHYYVRGSGRVLYWRCSVTSTKNNSTATSTPLPPLGHNPLRLPPQQVITPSPQGSEHLSADDHSVQTVPQSPSEHLTVDDVSVTPSSRTSSHGSRGDITHFFSR